MLRTLVVPIDGSPFSERALTLAVPLALQHGASITLTMAHPLPPRVENAPGVSADDAQEARDVRSQLRKHLERVAKRVATRSGVTTATQFREGQIIEEVTGAVHDTGAELLVMATHGRGGVSRLWLGSVTDALLRDPPTAMLITRTARKWTLTAPSEPIFPRVLVALDGSALSERALEETLRLVGDSPVELILLRVEDAPIGSVSEAWVRESTRSLNADYLEPLAARYRTPTRKVRTEGIVHTDAARAILDMAKSEHAFLITVATHGRSGFRRAMLGSVADKVIRGSTLPVLVAPPSAPGG